MLVRTEMLKFSSWTCLSNLAIGVLSYTCVVSVLFAGEQEEEIPWEWCCTPEDLLPIIIYLNPLKANPGPIPDDLGSDLKGFLSC